PPERPQPGFQRWSHAVSVTPPTDIRARSRPVTADKSEMPDLAHRCCGLAAPPDFHDHERKISYARTFLS
ncbi:MAG: hypothetical protein WAV12_01140, partial [Trebonia sp.]|uniref:hypothetical protein n=1 Tax=Trebonia sp. TaxID=2767075 RepID=UPI003BAEDE95